MLLPHRLIATAGLLVCAAVLPAAEPPAAAPAAAAANTTAPSNAPASLPIAVLADGAMAALAACKANGYNVTVTIMDMDMTTRLVLRGDGARDRTLEIGRRKAYTVARTGMSSGEFGKSVNAPAGPAPAAVPGAPPPLPGPVNGDPSLIAWPGGLPIMQGGKVVGAMSVSGAPGGDKDEACVKAGLDKIAAAAK